ncbi:hypothetical protein HYQ45_004511 [Verticillium longisporum]|uniref:Uncharacterized protein n=1 Tax=Verticillium longisporum TaxID=100787 RepID=A0A8I2ZSR0_VERLO|nr:hypothetical protein HYQ45_004511 [Verticillium longisporum]
MCVPALFLDARLLPDIAATHTPTQASPTNLRPPAHRPQRSRDCLSTRQLCHHTRLTQTITCPPSSSR